MDLKTGYSGDVFPGPACIPWCVLINTLILIKIVISVQSNLFFHANKSDLRQFHAVHKVLFPTFS